MTRNEQQVLWARIYDGLPPDKKRLADDILKRAPDNAAQQLKWAQELLALANDLAQPDSSCIGWMAVPMFWVRLHGAVTELAGEHRVAANLAASMPEPERNRNLAKWSLAIVRCTEDVLTALDEAEVVAVDYLRQRSVHLRQHAYALQPTKGGLRDTREIRHLSKTFQVQEIDRILAALLSSHGSELALAKHIARKVGPAAERLAVVLRDLHAQPPL